MAKTCIFLGTLYALANLATATYTSKTGEIKSDAFTYSMEYAKDTCTQYYGVHTNISIKNIDLKTLGVTDTINADHFVTTFGRLGLR